jgi:hypothetical protein
MRAALATSIIGVYALPNDPAEVAEERTAVILRFAQDDTQGF